VPRTHSAQMSRETWGQRFCSRCPLRPRIKTSSFHHYLQGKAATLSCVHSHVQRCAVISPTMLCVRRIPAMNLPHPMEYKSHRLVLDSTISLTLRCMRAINGPSTTCVASDLLIYFSQYSSASSAEGPKGSATYCSGRN